MFLNVEKNLVQVRPTFSTRPLLIEQLFVTSWNVCCSLRTSIETSSVDVDRSMRSLLQYFLEFKRNICFCSSRITAWLDPLCSCRRTSSRNKPVSSKTSSNGTRWAQTSQWSVLQKTVGFISCADSDHFLPSLFFRAPSLMTSQRPPTTFTPLHRNKKKVGRSSSRWDNPSLKSLL